MLAKVCDFIIDTALKNTSEFQYCVDFDYIEHHFGFSLTPELIKSIHTELTFRKEISDIQIENDCFDIVFFTSYTGY